MTLDEFNERITKPMLIKSIKAGNLDHAIFDPDCFDIIRADNDLWSAVKERAKKLDEFKWLDGPK